MVDLDSSLAAYDFLDFDPDTNTISVITDSDDDVEEYEIPVRVYLKNYPSQAVTKTIKIKVEYCGIDSFTSVETLIELTYILGSGPMDTPAFGFTQVQDCQYTESYEYLNLDTSYMNKSPDGPFFVLDSAELSLASDKETMTV